MAAPAARSLSSGVGPSCERSAMRTLAVATTWWPARLNGWARAFLLFIVRFQTYSGRRARAHAPVRCSDRPRNSGHFTDSMIPAHTIHHISHRSGAPGAVDNGMGQARLAWPLHAGPEIVR